MLLKIDENKKILNGASKIKAGDQVKVRSESWSGREWQQGVVVSVRDQQHGAAGFSVTVQGQTKEVAAWDIVKQT